MKILLVTPIRSRPDDPHYKWRRALTTLGHTVKLVNLSRFPAIKILKWLELFRARQRFKPNLVFFSAGRDAIWLVKKTVFFTGVAPEMLSSNERQISRWSRLVVVNEPADVKAWESLGAKKVICLPISAVDPADFKTKNCRRDIKVSFVGTLLPNRQVFLSRLKQRGVPIKVWGWLPPGVKILPELEPVYGGEAWGKRLSALYCRSLIGLNLVPEHLPLGGNLRSFEIPAAGAMLLTSRLNPGWFISGRQAVEFHGLKDCVQKINYYLNHQAEREKIANAGRRRCRSEHTYEKRFRRLMKHIAAL